ncbi:MAG: peptidoglycan-binding domain-containing protein [Pseudomonadota bacterium]
MRVTLPIVLLALCGAAWAKDVDGHYAVKGTGQMTCAAFNTALSDQSPDAKAALNWVAGYLTAVNATTTETFDIVSWQSEGMITRTLSVRCASVPNMPLARAVSDMVGMMIPDRISSNDELVTITVATRSRTIYRSVIRRMQKKLERLEEDVDASGEFDAITQETLRRYQASVGIAETGFPDSVTLLKLFSDER